MKSTALGAENIIFISDAHEKFYYEKLQEVRYQDVYHKALCYCLGINGDTRKNADRIYNFKTGSVKTKCLHEGWQTSGSLKVVRMAFNLYCNSTPSSVTGSMATKLKQYSDEGNLTELAVQLILNEKKTETGKVTLTEKKIRKYFPKEYNREQIEQVIYELLDNWKKSQ